MTIDELIVTGEKFNIKTVPGHFEETEYGIPQYVGGFKYLPNGDEFALWVQRCIRFLVQNFPKDKSIAEFENVTVENITQGQIYKLVGILKALKDIPVIHETPISQYTSTNIEITQSQNLKQNISFVLDILKEELSGEKYREVKEILSSDLPIKEKKRNLIRKLIGFGENVAASILASLLTKGL